MNAVSSGDKSAEIKKSIKVCRVIGTGQSGKVNQLETASSAINIPEREIFLDKEVNGEFMIKSSQLGLVGKKSIYQVMALERYFERTGLSLFRLH